MSNVHRFIFHDDEAEGHDRQTASLAGLAVALFLVVVGLFLVKELKHSSHVEDCLLAGRTNCGLLLSNPP